MQSAPAPASPLRWDPSLLEVVVRAEIERRRARGDEAPAAEFRRQAEPLYREPAAARDRAFTGLHAALFQSLGLHRPVVRAYARHAAALAGLARLEVRRAAGAADEGADLRVHEAGVRVGLLDVVPARFASATLGPFADHELTRLADLCDPAFGHDSTVLAAVPPHRRRLVQERYRLLWGVSADGRLARAGREPLGDRGQLALAVAGHGVGEDAFRRLWAGPRPTHAELLRMAVEAGARERSRPGAPCPLCGFPTHAWAVSPAPALIAAVQADARGWQPEDGMCARCLERYEAQATA
jgi:hypothetical protein